jgi:hypothetical protein
MANEAPVRRSSQGEGGSTDFTEAREEGKVLWQSFLFFASLVPFCMKCLGLD